MNKLNNLIEKALDKAKQDLNNEKVEVNYTPEFLIELLEEIKEVANAKYEIRKEWSEAFEMDVYIVYQNLVRVDGFTTLTFAQEYVSSREEVANV
jgi:hypothetical protein